MYPISPIFADLLKRRDREWDVKAVIADVEYGNRVIVDFVIENSLALGDEFEIGSSILSKLTITLRTNEEIAPNAKVIPYLSLSLGNIAWEDATFAWQDGAWPWVGGSTGWLPLGEFYIDSRERVNEVWVYTCYDKLVFADVPYISSLTYPTTQKAVWDEICTRLGYSYDSGVVINPAYQIQAGPAGYSMRQVMGYIASANSASVFVGKDGTVKFKRFSATETPVFHMDPSDYMRAVQTNPVKTYTRVVVTYNTEDGLTYEAGIGDERHTLHVENPFATQAIANDLLGKLNGFSYLPIQMDARGYPHLEAGDVIGFERNESTAWIDTNIAWEDMDIQWDGRVRYQTIALHTVYSFKGGLKMSIEAMSKSDQQSEFVVDGTLSGQINKLNQNTVRFGKPYYGITHSRTAGLVVEREDHKSKLTLNSDVMDWQVDGVSSLHYDALANRLKFTGTLEGVDGKFSGTVEGGKFIGGEIQIGTAFNVNSAGHMKAVGGEFSGEITAAIITGGQINGTTVTGSLIQTGNAGIFPRSEMSATGAYFGAYSSATRFIQMSPFFVSGSKVVLSFNDGGFSTAVFQDGSRFIISGGAGSIDLNSDVDLGPGVNLWASNWSNYQAGGSNLQTELNNKASVGVATNINGAHNHGIPDGTVLLVQGGGTVIYRVAAGHAHNQT